MRTLGRGAPRASGTGKSKRYKTDKIIGRGAFGTAYLVRSLADSRLYVMKRLKLDQLGQKERAEVPPPRHAPTRQRA